MLSPKILVFIAVAVALTVIFGGVLTYYLATSDKRPDDGR
jgi:hypothetical protein